jgi:hypothetical protein
MNIIVEIWSFEELAAIFALIRGEAVVPPELHVAIEEQAAATEDVAQALEQQSP